ncbi:MAG TPA: NAD-binding protein [Thermoplasmata archaeon]|nr:NAD-binding protein [Thermoplasmata archaeon]
MPGIRRRFLREVFLRIWRFLALFAAVYLVAAVAFYFLEGYSGSPLNAFYWAIVTLSTAGYGDVVPTNAPAKLLTMGVLFTQIFLLGYLISVISSTVSQEAQRRALGTLGTDMKDHIVVLGSSAVSHAAVRELLNAEYKVAWVVDRAEEVANAKGTLPEESLFVTYGAAADREILSRVNIADAHSVIVATGDDAVNLIAVLNLRAHAPNARVVVSVGRPELKETLRSAGVTFVASPGDMGGRLCASAAFEPEVALALEDLTAADVTSDIAQYMLAADTRLSSQSVVEAERIVRDATDCLVVGYARAKADGTFTPRLNPPQTDRLQPGDALLLIGTLENLRRFRRWWGRNQGR